MLRVQAAVSAVSAKITAPMGNADEVTDLLIALRAAGIPLSEMSVQKPTLDEVFLSLTGHGVEDDAAQASGKDNKAEGQQYEYIN
ncbi:hypothetical protein D3C81_1902050 [compost metagenome]